MNMTILTLCLWLQACSAMYRNTTGEWPYYYLRSEAASREFEDDTKIWYLYCGDNVCAPTEVVSLRKPGTTAGVNETFTRLYNLLDGIDGRVTIVVNALSGMVRVAASTGDITQEELEKFQNLGIELERKAHAKYGVSFDWLGMYENWGTDVGRINTTSDLAKGGAAVVTRNTAQKQYCECYAAWTGDWKYLICSYTKGKNCDTTASKSTVAEAYKQGLSDASDNIHQGFCFFTLDGSSFWSIATFIHNSLSTFVSFKDLGCV